MRILSYLGVIFWSIVILSACSESSSTSAFPRVDGGTALTPQTAAAARSMFATLRDPEKIAAKRRPIFSKPNVRGRNGPPAESWVIIADGFEVDVYDEADSYEVASCECRDAFVLAVSPKSGDLALEGSRGEAYVCHVTASSINCFATLDLPSQNGVSSMTYDDRGNLYVAQYDNRVVVYSAAQIAHDGGASTEIVAIPAVNVIYGLAAQGGTLLVAGSTGNAYETSALVSVDRHTLEQVIRQPEVPLIVGMVVDTSRNLLAYMPNISTYEVFSKPWRGRPKEIIPVGGGSTYPQFYGFSIDGSQTAVWIASTWYPYGDRSQQFTDVASAGYPFGSSGGGKTIGFMSAEVYWTGVALDPQAKT